MLHKASHNPPYHCLSRQQQIFVLKERPKTRREDKLRETGSHVHTRQTEPRKIPLTTDRVSPDLQHRRKYFVLAGNNVSALDDEDDTHTRARQTSSLSRSFAIFNVYTFAAVQPNEGLVLKVGERVQERAPAVDRWTTGWVRAAPYSSWIHCSEQMELTVETERPTRISSVLF